MGLDYNSSRIFALTLSRRAIDDVRRDGLRQLRNYVDLCAFLAKHPLARTFFSYAQTVLEEPDTPYYTLTKRLIDTVSENTLCTVGVNFGFVSMLHGSKKLAEYAGQGRNVSWLTFTTDADPELAASVEAGEDLGSFLWSIYVKGPLEANLLQLIAAHPQCTFQLTLHPEALSEEIAVRLAALPNVMPSIYLTEPCLTPAAKKAFSLLTQNHMLSAAFLWLDSVQSSKAPEPGWLEELSDFTPLCVCSRKPGMTLQQSEYLRKQIWANRLHGNGRLFLIDLESDLRVINQRLPDRVSCEVRPAMQADMPLCL